MAGKHTELKVGIFVALCFTLLALLIVNFSKGFSFVKTTYEIKLKTTDVGGIKERAGVLMSGVSIGFVKSIELVDNGKAVVLTLRIRLQYSVYRDAEFVIEQSGLLGDQYVAVVPKENKPPALVEGDMVETAPASDFKQMLRSAAGLIDKLDQTAVGLQAAVARVNTQLLNETNLGAISRAVANAESLTARANGTMDKLDAVIATNAPGIAAAVTNLGAFSTDLKQLSRELNSVVATNKDEIERTLKNLERASATADTLLADVKAGKGVVGGLLRDDDMKQQVAVVVKDLDVMIGNISTLASNLNRHGLFHKERKPFIPSTNAATPYTGRLPYR